MTDFTRTTLKTLEVIQKKSSDAKGTVVVLHGYGASYDDLFPIINFFKFADNYNWLFLNGPLKISMFPFGEGRAWFDFRFSEYQEALQTGTATKYFSEIVPEGIDEAVNQVEESISEFTKEKVILGGFSQGSMVSLLLGLKRPEIIEKLYLLSSTMLAKERFLNISEKFDFPILQTHGTADPVLPFQGALDLKDNLSMLKNYEFLEFSGGHELPMNVINKWGDFICGN